MARSNEDGLSVDGYIARIDRAIEALQDNDAFIEYPALTELLNGTAGRAKQTRRSLLIAVLEFIKKTAPRVRKTLEYETNKKTKKIKAYKLTIGGHKLAEIWGISYATARTLSYLFAEAMLLKRRKSDNDDAKEFSRFKAQTANKRKTSQNSQNRTPIIYAYWVDEWTPAQLRAIEAKTQALIAGGALKTLSRKSATDILGENSANAPAQTNAPISRKKVLFEQWFIAAYYTIRRDTGAEIVTKDQLFDELIKHIDPLEIGELTIEERAEKLRKEYQLAQISKTDAEIMEEARQKQKERLIKVSEKQPWADAKVAFKVKEGLDFRQLRPEEKKKYGLEGVTRWALIPCK